MNEDKFKQALDKFLDSIADKKNEKTTGMISSEGFYFWYSVNYLTNAAEMVIEDPKIGKLFSWKKLQEEIVKLTGKGKAKKESNTQIIEDILIRSQKNSFVLFHFMALN